MIFKTFAFWLTIAAWAFFGYAAKKAGVSFGETPGWDLLWFAACAIGVAGNVLGQARKE